MLMTEFESGTQVVMPKLGLTMTEAIIVEWHKAEGDRVEKGDALFTIETEKVTLDIEAPTSGVLHILVPVGETVPVLTPVAVLLPADAAAKLAPAEDGGTLPSYGGGVRASPKARTIARQRGISLAGLTGTGPRGMIVSADLESALPKERPVRVSPVARKLAAEAGVDLSAVEGTGVSGRVMRRDVEPMVGAPSEPLPLTGLRSVIAERLTTSWRERPHVTLTTAADATNLIAARQQAIAELGQKIPYDAFLVTLVARALRDHPNVNVRLTDVGVKQVREINVGVAVDTERGLLVPVVRDAASNSLVQVHQALEGLVGRALDGRSLPDDLVGGTFTITNLGMYEIDAFTPIINPPESAILGVGQIVPRPVAVERQVVVRDVVALSLSFDHRLIDGAPAARFLQRVKQLIERPFALAFLG
jgi:pyruvate dehydrogenase E2 component (dihydrolipoamide acetyltransferase)